MLRLIETKLNKERRSVVFKSDTEQFRGCDCLEITFSYSKGGYNYWNSKIDPRGYSIHVQPIKVNGRIVTTIPTDGCKAFLKEVKRQSQKAMNESIKDLSIYSLEELVDYVSDLESNHDEIEFIFNSIQTALVH